MTTENTTNTVVAATVSVVKAPRVRPAVQSRKAIVMDALKGLLADGKPRGPSEIARELNASGLTDLGIWTDAYHMLKSSGVFGVTFIEGAKRARYFLPTATTQAHEPVAPVVDGLGELNAELAELTVGLEEVAPVATETVVEPEAPVEQPVAPAANKKGKKAKAAKADATPAVEAPVEEEAKAA